MTDAPDLDKWLAKLRAGEVPPDEALPTLMAFIQAGVSPVLMMDMLRLALIGAIDKKRSQGGMDEKKLALGTAIRAQIAAYTVSAGIAPLAEMAPLVEMYRALGGADCKPKGRKPRKPIHRAALAYAAAAVAVLKKGQTVDAAIVEVATSSGISRKDLKNLYNRINRGRAPAPDEKVYRLALATFQKMQPGEVRSCIASMARDIHSPDG